MRLVCIGAFMLALGCTGHVLANQCAPPRIGDLVPLPDKTATLQLLAHDNVDNLSQSSIVQKFTITGLDSKPSDFQVRYALNAMLDRAEVACRSSALKIARISIHATNSPTSPVIGRLTLSENRPSLFVEKKLVSENLKGTNLSCLPGKAPEISFKLNSVDLPPQSKRKVLGTWLLYRGVTQSLEEVSGTVYMVFRGKYCESGQDGSVMSKSPDGKFKSVPDDHGEYYRIMADGKLALFNKTGRVGAIPQHQGLYAKAW